MIFCLLGKSASGKDTILNQVIKNGIVENIISTTTRPMRSNETEGISYHFVTKKEFLDKMTSGDFLETTRYDVAVNDDTWYYGIDGTKLDMNKNYITIVNPDGFRQIKAKIGSENVVGILVVADDKERLIRSLMRDSNVNCLEVCRRFLADYEDFKNVENEVKYIIKNRDLQQSVNIVNKIIEKELRLKSQQNPIEIGERVKILKILNTDDTRHLVGMVGKEGYIVGRISYKDIDRYKVLTNFDTNETYYFRRNELEVIE